MDFDKNGKGNQHCCNDGFALTEATWKPRLAQPGVYSCAPAAKSAGLSLGDELRRGSQNFRNHGINVIVRREVINDARAQTEPSS